MRIMRNFLGKNNYDVFTLSDLDVVEVLKKELGVFSESNIWENERFKNYAGINDSTYVLNNYFKPEGPYNSTALLNNFNIDATLKQWKDHSDTLFKCKFYHVPFQMIDFAKTKTELATLDIYNVIKSGYNCLGVVLNTDVNTGRGKHWFCLFCDFKHSGSIDDPYTLEYFNSSGNPPMSEVEIWLQTNKHNMKKTYDKNCSIVRSASRRLQHSQTECGVWSLMYIKSRLENRGVNWFYKVRADDRDMILLRKHLFRKS